MTTTVTTTTTTTVNSVAALSLNAFAIFTLVILLIAKETLLSTTNERTRTLSKAFNVAIVPLLIVFVLVMLVQIFTFGG